MWNYVFLYNIKLLIYNWTVGSEVTAFEGKLMEVNRTNTCIYANGTKRNKWNKY